jgi:hypothetical protein
MIQAYEEHGSNAPTELLSKLQEIRQKLKELSNEEIEMLDGPTTVPSSMKRKIQW